MTRGIGSLLWFLRQRNAQVWVTLINTFLVSVIAGFSIALNIVPPATFDAPFFSRFKDLGTQEQWAYWCAAVAMIGVLGVNARSRLGNLIPLFLVASFNGVIAILFWQSAAYGEHLTTGVMTYGLIATLGYVTFGLRATE